MINAGFVDFLFTGAAILPEVLMLAGYVDEGMLLMVPLLIAACLVSMYRQQVVPDASSATPDDYAFADDTAEGEIETRLGLTRIKPQCRCCGRLRRMTTLSARTIRAVLAAALFAGTLPAVAVAAEPAPIQREIIPGSELMTAQEREQYRQRQRGAKSEADRERLRTEHVQAMEERARLRGLKVSDPTRERALKGKQ